MPTVSVRTTAGAEAGTVDLADELFGIEPNAAVLHQVVTAQLAARRAGTHNTKTRAEVRGGGAKPWRQKGTGRARQGSIRSPQWRGGGVALGPKPRSYAQKTPKKMVRLALRSALSDRAAEGKVLVVDEWDFAAPRTKDAVAALDALGVTGRVLLVLDAADHTTWKSFRNLQEVHIIDVGQLNAYDVLCADTIIFSKATLPTVEEAPARPERAKAPKAPKAPAAPAPAAEDDDMASDLPNRPQPDEERRGPVDPRDRVKSPGEKVDPRFQAAKDKVDREQELRAKAEATRSVDDDDEAATDDAATDDAAGTEEGDFSFNQTGERSEDES